MYTQLFSKYIFRLIKTAVGTFATHSTNQRRKATTEWMLTSSMRWRIKINNSNVKRLPSYASLIHLPWRNGAPKIGTCKSVRSETLMTMEANAEKLSELPNESNHVPNSHRNPITHSHSAAIIPSGSCDYTLITAAWKDEIVFYGHSAFVCPFVRLKIIRLK